MSNPKLAIDALLETETKIGEATLHPLTVARYALLELVESPFLGKSDFSYMDVIPSWYIMTSPIETLKGYTSRSADKLKQDAMEATENAALSDLVEFTKAFTEKLVAINKVAPEPSGDANAEKHGKKARTAG